ncbi:MAG: hypothetical protein ACFE9S_03215 [Candidatus Hermodarchaeota archaeon]
MILKQIDLLRIKVKQLLELSDELVKRISAKQTQIDNNWRLVLENIQLEIAEIKSTVETLPNMYKEIIEKENLIRKKNNLKKLEKFEKKKKKFLDSLDGFTTICETLEDNLRNTLSQL